MDFQLFKDTVPEEILSRVRLQKLTEFIEKSLFFSIPAKTYFKSSFSLGDEMSWYGDQQIYEKQMTRAVFITQQMFNQGFCLTEILVYLAFERWKTAMLQNSKDPDKINMGKLRLLGKCVRTKMIRYRGLNTQRMCQNMDKKTDYTISSVHLNSNPERKFDMIKLKRDKEHIGTFILSKQFTEMKESEFFVNDEFVANDTIGYAIYEDTEMTLNDYQRLEKLFQQALSGDITDIAILHWWMCVKTPILRGGGSMAEWLSAALLEYHNIEFNGWSQDPIKEPWCVAVTNILEDFVSQFNSIFI